MEFVVGKTSIQISDVQVLALFWAATVAIAFNGAYLLFVRDRGRAASISRARILFTMLIGTLIVVGTYADTLADKPFRLKDCILLALVAAHGWMAEELVRSFVAKASQTQPIQQS